MAIQKNLFLRSLLSKTLLVIRSKKYTSFGGAPTSLEKRKFLVDIAAQNNVSNLVETGTYFGQSARYFSKFFKEVVSVEISPELYNFCRKKYGMIKNLRLVYGDSENILPKLIKRLDGPTLFYLDAHASGGVTGQGFEPSPIKTELKILKNFTFLSKSIIAIDDARGFNGSNSYPTVSEITEWAYSNNLMSPYIKFDMIIVEPNREIDEDAC